MNAPAVGYSGTPLAKKLGILEGSLVAVMNPPPTYRELVSPLPKNVKFQARATPETDITHIFEIEKSSLKKDLESLRGSMRKDSAIWVSWPKKSSRVPTDITEDTVRELALPIGLVDIKVCAVSEVWSGLELVIRKELR